MMGTSITMVDDHYSHLTQESEESRLSLLTACHEAVGRKLDAAASGE